MLTLNKIRDLLNKTSKPVLSLYLNVDRGHLANQNEQPAWRIASKNALSDADDAVAKQVKQYLEDYTPSSKSLVLFADETGILADFHLPVAIENQHAMSKIDVVPLIWLMDEYERYLVVLVDQEQARFMSAYLGNASTNDEMSLDFDDYDFGNKQFIHANHSSSADSLQGSGGEQFDDMKQEHIRRFHRDVAEQIRDVMKDMQSERVILGGSEQAAHQLKDFLHDTNKNQVVDILSIPVDTSDSDVAEQIRTAALNYERTHELDLVNDVIDLAKSGGRGAIGNDAILDALEMQQVELLILPYPMDDYEMAKSLTLMAIDAGTEIELVHGSAATRLKDEGEALARLYYRINEPENSNS